MGAGRRSEALIVVPSLELDFQSVFAFAPALIQGVQTTLLLTGLTIALGTPIGIVLGVLLGARAPLVRMPLLFIVDVVRSLPALILILWVYYVVPTLLGTPTISSFTLATLALVTNLAAFVADVVRGSIAGVPRGLIDAGYASGLSRFAVLWHVTLPLVVRELLPTLALLWIDMLKLSSLASVISVYELVHTADKIRSETFRAIEVFSVIAAIYLAIIMPFSSAVRWLERTRLGRRST